MTRGRKMGSKDKIPRTRRTKEQIAAMPKPHPTTVEIPIVTPETIGKETSANV